jgi:hypothetical protein
MKPSLNPARMRIGIIGGGRRCLAIMELLGPDSLKRFQGEIVGVADPNPEAVDFSEARRRGIFTTDTFRNLFNREMGLTKDRLFRFEGALPIEEGPRFINYGLYIERFLLCGPG